MSANRRRNNFDDRVAAKKSSKEDKSDSVGKRVINLRGSFTVVEILARMGVVCSTQDYIRIDKAARRMFENRYAGRLPGEILKPQWKVLWIPKETCELLSLYEYDEYDEDLVHGATEALHKRERFWLKSPKSDTKGKGSGGKSPKSGRKKKKKGANRFNLNMPG